MGMQSQRFGCEVRIGTLLSAFAANGSLSTPASNFMIQLINMGVERELFGANYQRIFKHTCRVR